MRKNLRDVSEFQHVYRNGKRFDGAVITVFVLDNDGADHRLGVTASRKALGNAVQRNRAKRLLRESFRASQVSLNLLQHTYDWVLNAKASVLNSKAIVPTQELDQIIKKIGHRETRAPRR